MIKTIFFTCPNKAIVFKKSGSATVINARQATNDVSSIGVATNALN